jgi:hypothetical protein
MNHPEAIDTLLFVARLMGLAIIFQSLEFIKIKDSLSEKGIWRWSELRSDYSFLPEKVRQFLDWVMKDSIFNEMIKLRFFMGILAALYPHFFIIFVFLFLSSFLITLRWRGSFNGGSDYMTLIILLCLCIAFLNKDSSILAKGALWYISLQVISSYFLAGLYKIKQEKWRSGKAIYGFVSSPNYKVPQLVLTKSQDPIWAMRASWAVMIFEISFPLALLHPNLTLIYLLAGAFFHLGNFWVFGLNRFFWIWCASYPAIYYSAKFIQA